MYCRNLSASGLEQCVAECPSKGVELDAKEVIRVAINVSFIATTTTATTTTTTTTAAATTTTATTTATTTTTAAAAPTVITTCMYNLISHSLI